MTQYLKCACGAENDETASFCRNCGDALGTLWPREEEEFAVYIPQERYTPGTNNAVVIKHGSKGLILENGKLVQIVESGRYALNKESVLGRLFNRSRSYSVFIVDAGDASLGFEMVEIWTKDNFPVDIGIEIVFSCRTSNAFFINVMKNRECFELHEFRRLFYPEVRNALEECLKQYTFADLNTGHQFKTEIASRMAAHLRTTFDRFGLEFIQVKSIRFHQEKLKDLKKRAANRSIKEKEIKETRADVDLKGEEIDVETHDVRTTGNREVERDLARADLLQKRVDVLKAVQTAETERIKTENEFEKFKNETDREKVLDEKEWDDIKREMLWQNEDTVRDRKFLISKIQLTQAHDLKRLEILNTAELSEQERKNRYNALDYELKNEMALELQRIEGRAKIEMARTRSEAARKSVEKLEDKETDIQSKLKDLEYKRIEAEQEAALSVNREKARHEVETLKVEENRMKGELGLLLREKKDAQDIKCKQDESALKTEEENRLLDLRLREAEAGHRQQIESRKSDARIELDRISTIKELGLEQLIAVSGQRQADVLGDLAQSRTLKGMSADEIMAMKNPAAFKEALMERAKKADNEEIKTFYERIIQVSENASLKEAAAYRESAERFERMAASQKDQAKEAFRAMSGQNQMLADTREKEADKTLRMSQRAMDNMG
ncbi:MAG: SPFH domain-containing protein, partial [Thermodesulfobacteriota bacterium]|nr:SPFH domain-containing protein [Thermodesulfobacteriota bacterium]